MKFKSITLQVPTEGSTAFYIVDDAIHYGCITGWQASDNGLIKIGLARTNVDGDPERDYIDAGCVFGSAEEAGEVLKRQQQQFQKE